MMRTKRIGTTTAGLLALALVCAYFGGLGCHGESQPFSITRLQDADSEGEARAVLESLGCELPTALRLTRRVQTPMFVALAAVAVCIAFAVAPVLRRRNLVIDIGNLLIAAGLLVAAWQWQASVEQKAMEQYADDVGALNDAEMANPDHGIHDMMRHLYPLNGGNITDNDAKTHYVYVQLDNLEYALERYRQGLASAETTVRAVNTFQGRCTSVEFQNRVRRQLTASYPRVVRRAVGHLNCGYLLMNRDQ